MTAKIKPFDLDLGNGETVRIEGFEEVNLDTDPITLSDGTVLDEAGARDYGRRVAERLSPGRPSLTAPGKHSPQIALRVPAELDERLRARAEAEHKRVSDIVREAIDAYL